LLGRSLTARVCVGPGRGVFFELSNHYSPPPFFVAGWRADGPFRSLPRVPPELRPPRLRGEYMAAVAVERGRRVCLGSLTLFQPFVPPLSSLGALFFWADVWRSGIR